MEIHHMKIGLLAFFHLLHEFLGPLDLSLEIVVAQMKVTILSGNYLIHHANSLTSYAVGTKMEIFILIYLAYSQ